MSTPSPTNGVRPRTPFERRTRLWLFVRATVQLGKLEDQVRDGEKADPEALKSAARLVLTFAMTWEDLLMATSEAGVESFPDESSYAEFLSDTAIVADPVAWLSSQGITPIGQRPTEH